MPCKFLTYTKTCITCFNDIFFETRYLNIEKNLIISISSSTGTEKGGSGSDSTEIESDSYLVDPRCSGSGTLVIFCSWGCQYGNFLHRA